MRTSPANEGGQTYAHIAGSVPKGEASAKSSTHDAQEIHKGEMHAKEYLWYKMSKGD
jgi:hypothetical protein